MTLPSSPRKTGAQDRAARPAHALTLDFYGLDRLYELVTERPRLELSQEVAEKIRSGAEFVQRKAQEDRFIYGVNTGFGALCEQRVGREEGDLLQYNHVVSHACGVGESVAPALVRTMLLVKLFTFRSGHTGVSLPTVQRLLDFWNHDVMPVVPKKGTVGASGDLAPLAHMALPLLGLGRVWLDGEEVDAAVALERFGWEPLRLKAKEGLALTNGVQYINAIAAQCLVHIEDLVRAADLVAALSIQAFSASSTFYQAAYHETSHHLERRVVAANLRRLLDGSNHAELGTCNQSQQDPYSFRCIPQVHGAVRQAVRFAREIVERECNSVSDNPLFFPEQDLILFGGNLHGESTAISLDLLSIAVAELASISERRTYLLLSGERGLPDFLVKEPGINSGLMISQYTSAALVNENKVLASPASVDTVPTCQLQEDHVSMGGTSAYKLQQVVENCQYILGIELMTASQAAELNEELRLSLPLQALHGEFRERVSFLERDRILSSDMEASRVLVRDRARSWARRWGVE